MRILLVSLLGALALCAQSPTYPSSYDTDASLFLTGDNIQTTLLSPMQATDTVAVVTSSSGFAANMIATVCDSINSNSVCTSWEHMFVSAVSGNILTVTRGFAGTTAKVHSAGKYISVLIDSAHQSVLRQAVIAIEHAVGLTPVSSGNYAAVSVPTATSVPAVLGSYVDGNSSNPQATNAVSSVIFQRANALPNNIATAFTFDCYSTTAAGANMGCITVNAVIHDVGFARGGSASRHTAFASASAAATALSSATLSSGTITVTTGSAHNATAGSPVIISGSSGMTGLNNTFTVASIVSPTQFTASCGGCSGGPGTGGIVTVPASYFASWDSAWKETGPNIRVVGRESDMNNQYADAGASTGAMDATFNDALYCSLNNCTVATYIDSGDGTHSYYHPLLFGPHAVVANYPYIDTSSNNNAYGADFAWVGNDQFMRWLDTSGGKWPIFGLDSNNNTRISSPTAGVIQLGPNLTTELAISSTLVSARTAMTMSQRANYIASETGANNAIAGALADSLSVPIAAADGLLVTVKLAHSLQAGSNTFNLNGTSAVAIKSCRNPASNIATAYVSGGQVTLLYNGANSVWCDVSQ